MGSSDGLPERHAPNASVRLLSPVHGAFRAAVQARR